MKHFLLALALSLSVPVLIVRAEDSQPASLDTGTSGAKIATASSHHFDFDTAILHSEDYADWTPAVTFDWLLQSSNAVNWPSESWALRFAGHGTLALDPELNRDPLRASIDFYYEAMPGEKKAVGGWKEPMSIDEADQTNPGLLEAGLSAAYETDQSLDHRQGRVSAFINFLQPLGNTVKGQLPSFIAAFDGVLPDKNATADAMNVNRDAHVRLRLQADWVLRFSAIKATRQSVLRHLSLHGAAVYTKEFGPADSWENAGLDEAFGAYVEAAWNFTSGIDPSGKNHTDPLTIFVRTTFGRFDPVPEDDRGLMMGVRYSF